MDLTTLNEVKCVLGENTNDFDADLQLRITAISKRADHVAGRIFEKSTYVEIHHGGEKRLYIDNPPIESITEIVWDDFANFSNGFVIASSDYHIVNRGWDIASTIGPFPGTSNEEVLRVTYIGGYLDANNASTTLPADLTYAIAEQVVYEFRRRKDIGLRDVSMPNGNIVKVTDRQFLPKTLDTIKTYRVLKIG